MIYSISWVEDTTARAIPNVGMGVRGCRSQDKYCFHARESKMGPEKSPQR